MEQLLSTITSFEVAGDGIIRYRVLFLDLQRGFQQCCGPVEEYRQHNLTAEFQTLEQLVRDTRSLPSAKFQYDRSCQHDDIVEENMFSAVEHSPGISKKAYF
ncbi:hypothetical protein J6590_029332 [Homalodisca vitripennis]|nr:hypothetical protein J6590_029332 [Homalodisca vitripennis]